MKQKKTKIKDNIRQRCLNCGNDWAQEIRGYIGRCPVCASYNTITINETEKENT